MKAEIAIYLAIFPHASFGIGISCFYNMGKSLALKTPDIAMISITRHATFVANVKHLAYLPNLAISSLFLRQSLDVSRGLALCALSLLRFPHLAFELRNACFATGYHSDIVSDMHRPSFRIRDYGDFRDECHM